VGQEAEMEDLAAYLMFMLVAMAIGLSVIVAAVFCIAICEAATWVWARSKLNDGTHTRSVIAHR
jgi:hypothetical protein